MSTSISITPPVQPDAVAPAPVMIGTPHPFNTRLAIGLTGIFLAAMMAGLNNRVASLALADIRGALGFGLDEASWLNTVYAAGELIAMPFAAWFAITLSLRRFHLAMLALCALFALMLPFVHNLTLLLILRALQGLTGGALIPLLMMAALRFLPPPIRLHGLALYSMTATFSPNLAIWFAGQWTDQLFDWRLIYWQIIPVAALSMALVSWGIPQDPLRLDRFREGNWPGLAIGATACALLTVALDQGIRLDWFNSPLIVWAMCTGIALLIVYLLTEWFHPAPFIKLQLLERRNLGLGFAIFVCLLVIMLASSLLPSQHLERLWDYRTLQSAPIGLIIGLPQLLLGPTVALLLYRKWVDARIVFAVGLALIAYACFLGAQLTSEWIWEQFVPTQLLFALGLPMTVVPLLFLGTSIVLPSEGPYVSGTVNTLRVFGTLIGSAVVGQLLVVRKRFHADMQVDRLGLLDGSLNYAGDWGELPAAINRQASVLATADAYFVLGVAALLLIPLVLYLHYIPAPDIPPRSSPQP